MQSELKAAFVGVTASVLVLALTFGFAAFLRSSPAAEANRNLVSSTRSAASILTLSSQAQQGRNLFERNCAHCHGEDARGDEGPTLHHLALSDARIARRIKEGVKGEMPRFGSKLDDAHIAELIAYLRTLRD